MNLNWYYDKFVELEKIIILEDWQLEAKKKLKAAIDNQTPEETLTDWQNSLKKYGLDIFTQDKLDKWKQKKDGQAKFDNLATFETLLKKVCVFKDNQFEKVEEGFITYLKKKDSKLDSLSKLIEQKEPVEVIKLITYYTEYEKLSEEDKKTKKQKLVWTLEKKDKDGKYLDDADLTEEEITQTLYEIAIGKKTLASQKKEDSSDNGQNPTEETPNKSWFKFGSGNIWRPLLTYLGIALLLFGAGIAIFWDKVTAWWNGPAEEEGTVGTTEKEDEE